MKHRYYDGEETTSGLFSMIDIKVAISQRVEYCDWKGWLVFSINSDLAGYLKSPKPARCVIDDYGTLVKVGEGW